MIGRRSLTSLITLIEAVAVCPSSHPQSTHRRPEKFSPVPPLLPGAVAVAYREGDVVVLDAIREVRSKPSLSPEQVSDATVVPLFKTYRVDRTKADRWAGNFPIDCCKAHGILLEPARPKSELASQAP